MIVYQQPGKPDKAGAVALAGAGIGWMAFAYGLLAEYDTGYPDGTTCTGRAPASEAYANCLRTSETGGAIVWSAALGVALLGLVVLARTRSSQTGRGTSAIVRAVAWIAAGSLAATAAVTVALGAGGRFYEDRIGPVVWIVAFGVTTAVGVSVGWTAAPRLRRPPE